ncbi:MAG: SpoIIE family protein phosphatase [Acidobacteriaceae bacterium]
MLQRAKTAALIFFFATSLFARSQVKAQPSLMVQGLGNGSIQISGPWQFHLGDDVAWASPSFDDSTWEPIHSSSSWGSQDHRGYTGFAWYRRHLQIHTADSSNSHYVLLMPPVDDAYEVYWNGARIGSYGKLPPHPRWSYTSLYRAFPIPSTGSGVLAIRVWKSPLLFVDPASLGGMNGTPLLGDADTIAAEMAAFNAGSLRQFLYGYTLIILYGFVTLFSLLLWSRDRKAKLFLWLAVFTAMPVLLSFLQGQFPIPVFISYGWGRGLIQPIYVLNRISLWFLLLWLLRLNERRTLVRWTNALAVCTLTAGVLDGALAFFWGEAGHWMQWMDAILTSIIFVVEVFPFVIIAIGLQHRLEPSRWWVAISALASQMIDTVADISAAGQRFTHWTLFELVNTPVFVIRGVAFTLANLVAIVLFLSILYAVYRYSAEQQARQNVLEHEMQSAREIQQVLIPDTLPALEGFAITSAYRPALEVGGDFFQIIREKQGSAIIALGDVSGKGLKAAMRVSLIVGVLRSLTDANYSPVEIMERLNRCLCERRQGGFVTALILRFYPDGALTLANAGHLPPFLNQQELSIEGSLPLGILPSATYDEVSILLQPGDQLSLYTDGVVEARSITGELYGFDRLHALFASRPSAQQATEAAVAFGQDDDITVLTLTRLAAGEESTTSLNAPLLEPSTAAS